MFPHSVFIVTRVGKFLPVGKKRFFMVKTGRAKIVFPANGKIVFVISCNEKFAV